MYATGFLQEKRRSPVSLAAVVGLHVAAIGAVIMFGTTTFIANKGGTITMIDIPIEPPPPPDQPPPPRTPDQPRQLDVPTITPPVLPPVNPPVTGDITPPRTYQEPQIPVGPRVVVADATPVIPTPVRRDAIIDPNYRDALQPPYPRDQEMAQRTGSVRVRVTIGTDGRVAGIEQISATNDSFWRATERQARRAWRFRPATVDGRPVTSTMVFTVTFRLPDA